jgi:hypothetical protein
MLNAGGGGGGGKISNAQNLLNQEFNDAIGKIENEVKRLGRIDFRLNNELTQKPYLYIDKVKEALDKE